MYKPYKIGVHILNTKHMCEHMDKTNPKDQHGYLLPTGGTKIEINIELKKKVAKSGHTSSSS